MKDDPADVELHAMFRGLRNHDDSRVPPFDASLARGCTPPAKPRLQAAWRYFGAAGTLAALLLGLFWAPLPPMQTEPGPATPLSWRVPSDGLLAPAPVQTSGLAWDSLPTTALGRPSFSRYAEDR